MSFENEIQNEYFDWLYNYMCGDRVNSNISYKKLFMFLHNTEFKFVIPKDVNRAQDGVDLRYRFACDAKNNYDVDDILDILGGTYTCNCSVLEMITALAIRCEETIMDNPLYGDRTTQWFWIMLKNLGLNTMSDTNYDRNYVSEKIDIFLHNEYEPNGKGGLFYIPDENRDLRNVEIWTQLCWFLSNRF